MAELPGVKKKSKRDYIPKFAHNSPNHNLFHNSGQSPACCNFHRSLSTVHSAACRKTCRSQQLCKHSSTSSPLLFSLRRYYLLFMCQIGGGAGQWEQFRFDFGFNFQIARLVLWPRFLFRPSSWRLPTQYPLTILCTFTLAGSRWIIPKDVRLPPSRLR